MQIIAEALSRVRIDPGVVHENLTVFPLIANDRFEPDYLTLDEALARKVVRVTEVSERGSVHEVYFHNESGDRVLLVDGEELVGSKQNRIVNLSVLVSAKRRVRVPVSCVERDRWQYASQEFSSGEASVYATLRAAKAGDVSTNLIALGVPCSDQKRVWRSIDAKFSSLGCSSVTTSMSDIYLQRRPDTAGYQRAFTAAEGQVGAIFAVSGVERRVVGLEICDSPATFARLLHKLVASYALDAMEGTGERPWEPTVADAEALISRVKTSATKLFLSTDEGQDARFTAPGITGGALVAHGRVVHLVAFAAPDIANAA